MNEREFQALIAKYLRLRTRLHKDVYRNIGMSEAAYFKKMKTPDEFRLREIRNIYNYLEIPQTERLF